MDDRISEFNDFLPPHIAEQAEASGAKKAGMAALPMLLLAVLAGAFIAIGGNFYTVVMTDSAALPWGVAKSLGGLAFSLGLILVVVGGAELFTGNSLIVRAVASRRATLLQLLRNWLLVYVGNFAGSIATAYLIFLSTQYTFDGGAVGATAVKIAEHKCSLDFVPALMLGVYCNALVCLAVWLSLGARSISGKVLGIVFPITAFIAGGFEHCVANMYLVPLGIFIKAGGAGGGGALGEAIGAAPHVNWADFIVHNLVPVTIGNIIGGGVMVGGVYWLIYRWPRHQAGK